MTDYLIEREAYGRTERIVDIGRFVADLAKQLGGEIEKEDGEIEKEDTVRHIRLNGLQLSVYSNRYQHKDKVHISAYPLDILPDDRPYHDTRGTYKMADAYVSVTRPIATIAKDIKRRVIDANQEVIANIRNYAAQQVQLRNDIATVGAKLSEQVPEMRERQNGSRSNSYSSRTFDWSAAGNNVFLTARAYADGFIDIDRIGNISLAAFVEICDVLRRHGKAR